MTCTVQKDTSQQNSNPLTQQINESSTNRICTINIGSTHVSFLIDTGANHTLLSGEKIPTISKGNNHNLKQLSGRILRQADRTPNKNSQEIGCRDSDRPVVVQHEVIVAKISDEGIIFYDFLANKGCKIDVGK